MNLSIVRRRRPYSECRCPSLAERAVVPIGFDLPHVEIFATFEELRSHEPELWWLHLSRCGVCGQHWMVAWDDRIYDDIFLKRLDPAAAEQILKTGSWPPDFLTYERVLALGRAMSRPPTFLDPFCPALQATVADLRKARPAITPDEIAHLLGIPHDHASLMYRNVGLFEV
jgi:hypothetical protein